MGYQMKHGNSGVPFKMLGSSSLKEYSSSPLMKKKGFKDNYQGPCWDGYKQVGMKEKDGKQVPNCVPA